MNVLEWLDKEHNVDRGNGVIEKSTILRYMTELIAVNGGSMELKHFGRVMPNAGHPYGRLGLTLEEAFALVNLVSTMNGFWQCHDSAAMVEACQIKIQDEITRIKTDPSGGIGGSIEIFTEHDLKKIDASHPQDNRRSS